MKLLLCFAACVALYGQGDSAPPVRRSQILFYDGNNNVIYVCTAAPVQRTFDFKKQAQFTNIVVAANVATVTTSANHGLQVNNPIVIAGSATTALNGTYAVASVPTTTTFTVATSGVGNGTYTDPTVVSTTAPRSSDTVWSIQRFTYSGTNITNVQTSVSAASICDNRATVTYQ